MKEVAFAIPSKGRPLLIQKLTLSLINEVKDNIFVFVEPKDFERYENIPNVEIVEVPRNDFYLPKTRGFIQEYLDKRGYRYVWQLDDNIDQFIKREGKTEGGYPHLEPMSPGEIPVIFEETLKILKENDYIQGTLSFRPTNWCFEGLVKENGRAWGIVLNDNRKMVENDILYDEECLVFEDYDITAQILNKRFKNFIYHKYAFHKKMAHYDGGCQTYRDSELADKICSYIKKKYGEKVKIKFNEKHGIKEPFFKWKKFEKLDKDKTLERWFDA